MKYVILGSSAAGINAGRELRSLDGQAEITIISQDSEIYSRCIIHHYLGHIRTIPQLNFAEPDYFDQFRIQFLGGESIVGLDTTAKTVKTDKGTVVPYDALLIATGSSSYIPPIEGLDKASNYVGFRNLEDIQFIHGLLPRKQVVVLGAGLVGMDCVTGLLHLGIPSTIVEMGEHALPKQLDSRSAQPYMTALDKAGVTQCYGVGVAKALVEGDQITALQLTDGREIPCDLLVVTAGIRSNVDFLEGTEVAVGDHGLVFDSFGRTNVADIYGAGDVSGLSPIWPVAVKEGIIAAHNMTGGNMELSGFFASKSTMNFCDIPTLSLGDINMEASPEEIAVCETEDSYKKIIHREGKIMAAVLQGDLAYSGILQQLILHKIDVRHVKKPIFDIDYSDFFQIDQNFEYFYQTV